MSSASIFRMNFGDWRTRDAEKQIKRSCFPYLSIARLESSEQVVKTARKKYVACAPPSLVQKEKTRSREGEKDSQETGPSAPFARRFRLFSSPFRNYLCVSPFLSSSWYLVGFAGQPPKTFVSRFCEHVRRVFLRCRGIIPNK